MKVQTTGGPWAHLVIHGRSDSFSLPASVPCGSGVYSLVKIRGSGPDGPEDVWRYRWQG